MSKLMNEQNRLERSVHYVHEKQKIILNQYRVNFGFVARNSLGKKESNLRESKLQLEQQISQFIERSKSNILLFESKVNMLDPMEVMKRGFTLTTFNGKVIQEKNFPKQGEKIQTITSIGKINSKVEY
jgi:exodeoxyribonuclease VII large subunit